MVMGIALYTILMHVCMYIYVCMYVVTYVCTYVCMYCMYVCMLCMYQRLKASTSFTPELLCNALPSPLEWAFALVRSRCIQVEQHWHPIILYVCT